MTDEDFETNPRGTMERLERLEEAIEWALGYTSFRPRENGEGAYWWRAELRKRAGISDFDYVASRRKGKSDAL